MNAVLEERKADLLEPLQVEELELHRRLRDYSTASIEGRLRVIADEKDAVIDREESAARQARAAVDELTGDLQRASIDAISRIQEATAAIRIVLRLRAEYDPLWSVANRRGVAPERVERVGARAVSDPEYRRTLTEAREALSSNF